MFKTIIIILAMTAMFSVLVCVCSCVISGRCERGTLKEEQTETETE